MNKEIEELLDEAYKELDQARIKLAKLKEPEILQHIENAITDIIEADKLVD